MYSQVFSEVRVLNEWCFITFIVKILREFHNDVFRLASNVDLFFRVKINK